MMADSPLIDIRDSGGPRQGPADDKLIDSEVPEQERRGTTTTTTVEKGGESPKGRCTGISWPWSKRDRLRRDPSLDKVDEDLDQGPGTATAAAKGPGGGDASSPTRRCPDYFGVRSYLHHFYETRSPVKDPEVYEEADDTRRLLNPSAKRRHHCTAAWWKGFVLVGVLFLLVGIVCVLVGYLLPQRPILVGMVGVDREVIDRQAIAYNYNLDACKLVGLILFCLGGLTLAVALMIPSFLYRYCDDDDDDDDDDGRPDEGGFAVPIGGGGCGRRAEDDDDAAAFLRKDPLFMAVPSTERLTEVQPSRKQDEAGLGRDGAADYPIIE